MGRRARPGEPTRKSADGIVAEISKEFCCIADQLDGHQLHQSVPIFRPRGLRQLVHKEDDEGDRRSESAVADDAFEALESWRSINNTVLII